MGAPNAISLDYRLSTMSIAPIDRQFPCSLYYCCQTHVVALLPSRGCLAIGQATATQKPPHGARSGPRSKRHWLLLALSIPGRPAIPQGLSTYRSLVYLAFSAAYHIPPPSPSGFLAFFP